MAYPEQPIQPDTPGYYYPDGAPLDNTYGYPYAPQQGPYHGPASPAGQYAYGRHQPWPPHYPPFPQNSTIDHYQQQPVYANSAQQPSSDADRSLRLQGFPSSSVLPDYPAPPQTHAPPQGIPVSLQPGHIDPSSLGPPSASPTLTARPVPPIVPTLAGPQPPIGVTTKLKFRNPNAAMAGSYNGDGHDDARSFSSTGRPRRGVTIAAERSRQTPPEPTSPLHKPNGDDDADGESEDEDEVLPTAKVSRSGRMSRAPDRYLPDDAFDAKPVDTSPVIGDKRASRVKRKKVIVDPDEDDDFSPTKQPSANGSVARSFAAPPSVQPNGRTTRAAAAARTRHSSADGDSFNPDESDHHSSPDPIEDIGEYEHTADDDDDDEDDLESYDERPRRRKTRSSTRRSAPVKTERRRSTRQAHTTDDDEEYGATGRRSLRVRSSRPNYQLPPVDISAELETNMLDDAIGVASGPSGRSRAVGFAGGTRFGGAAGKGLPWSMKGKDLAQAMGDPDTSDSDDLLTPAKPGGHRASIAAGGSGPSADVPNFGRINPKSNMADADPLGVDVNVTFDRVGGLDNHIDQLKEMVALPLLYPELFQQFGITPPRGVLFHGPPGTGKTLLARALAASCSNGNTKIAFFMRKGADVLSKWVGEAERQLRMLFEEARASQPSIIFFDEIDGLAPVRSSKQDQIHASLVSTLLALMDGMDGRGQVIVIGATNRPDAVDPALRRPGRFDREFYFPLPNIEARRKIIGINTREWDPPLESEMLDRLAVLTKGYGGADLRALCTEAALNAIQRRYPQIYRTADRLMLEPKSIRVLPKDFMMAVKNIVPSSARSTASSAIQLPPHLAPLLTTRLEQLKAAVTRALPDNKKRSALEEAEWEDDDGGFEKEVMLQAMDKMRTFRPRVLVYGDAGMGQTYLGPAILHHLEGFHVQSLDLATLLGDSTRTPEAALIQLFTEAKRHQPSVLFIPNLAQWASTLSDTARSTARALLDSVPPSDPILVLAIMDGHVDELPRDVRGWFGVREGDRIELGPPSAAQREAFFADVLASVARPPTEFPDALPRRKRILEALPLAPPLPPRAPTEAEIARETERDLAARNMMQMSFNSLVAEFNKKYKRAVALVKEEVMSRAAYAAEAAALATAPIPIVTSTILDDEPVSSSAPAAMETIADPPEPVVPSAVEGEPATAPPAIKWTAHDVDVDTLHRRLIRNKYYTPQDFLDDINLIEENALRSAEVERQLRVLEMVGHARSHVATFDPKWTPEFERYKERMLKRKEERKKKEGKEGKANEGEQPTAGQGDTAEVVVAPEADTAKRPREDSEGDDEARKRPRGMDIDLPGSPRSLAVDVAVSSVPTPLAPLSPMPTVSTEPEPQPPVYPPFAVPPLGRLATLLGRTDSFNVDELEALRAGCIDCVWRHRADWDRTSAVHSLEGLVERYIDEVEGRRAADGDA